MSRVRLRALLAGSTGAALAFVACNGVLGIDEATFDPTFDGGGKSEAAVADAGSTDDGHQACSDYCRLITERCTGVNQQYYEGSCLKICNAFVSADNKIRKGDNAACRAFELAQVEQGTSATTRNDHCFNAGPFGGDQCSEPETRPDCQTFCGLTTLICPAAASGYANLSACVTACQAKFASNNKGELFAADGTIFDNDKNTLNCRMLHLEIAASQPTDAGRDLHCSHTSITGGGQCVK